MKSVILYQHGGPEVLTVIDRDIPTPGPGEILIRMKSAGISRPDKLMRTGTYPWTKDILPFYPGLYGAGIVEALGPEVTGLKIGQQVYVEHPIACGCYSEYKVAPTRFVTPIPDGTDLSLAAIATSSLIVWGMLTECFPHSQGKTLYIQGAAGSIGTAVCQIAPLLGIRVIASASTEDKCNYLHSIGNADVFCYTREDVGQKVLSLTDGRGADIIMDQSIGNGLILELDYLADMGTVLMYNNTKGSPSADLIEEMVKRFGRCPAIRAFSFHYFDNKPELLRKKKQEMFELLRTQKIKPHIGAAFPLEDVQKAHELLDSGNFFGSIILSC